MKGAMKEYLAASAQGRYNSACTATCFLTSFQLLKLSVARWRPTLRGLQGAGLSSSEAMDRQDSGDVSFMGLSVALAMFELS